jgi:hypothetical protein
MLSFDKAHNLSKRLLLDMIKISDFVLERSPVLNHISSCSSNHSAARAGICQMKRQCSDKRWIWIIRLGECCVQSKILLCASEIGAEGDYWMLKRLYNGVDAARTAGLKAGAKCRFACAKCTFCRQKRFWTFPT